MTRAQHLKGHTYRVRVGLGIDPRTGKRRQVSKSFRADGQKAADRQAETIRREIEARAGIFDNHGGSLASLLDDWLAVKAGSVKPTTYKSYQDWVSRISTDIGAIPAEQLSSRDVDRWLAQMVADGTTPATARHGFAVLRAALGWARKSRGLPSVATDGATPPRHQHREEVDMAIIPRLIAALPREPYRASSRAFLLAAMTGMRRGEIVGVKIADVSDGELVVRRSVAEVKGQITIDSTKTNRWRTIALSAAAQQVIAEQIAWLADSGIKTEWLFPDWHPTRQRGRGGGPARPGWLSRAWARHRSMHDAEHVKLHHLRHHFGSAATEVGISPHDIAAQLGHAQTTTTIDTYGHATGADRQRMVDAVSERIQRK